MEIDADKKVSGTVKLVMRDGSISLIIMKVPWFPTKCTTCNIFGHFAKTRPKVEKKFWQVKKDLPPKDNENLPSSTCNSVTQDYNGNSSQRVSGLLLSHASQGSNGSAHRQTYMVLHSLVVSVNSSMNKNSHISIGNNSLYQNVNEMVNLLV